jgi:MSHA biogenesis protein MshJ
MAKSAINNLAYAFNALEIRQRIVLVLCALTVFYGLWYFLVGASAEKSLILAQQENEYLLEQAAVLHDQALSEEGIKQSLATVELNKKLQSLQEEVNVINSDLANYLSIIVDADELMAVVKKILESQSELVIEEIKLLPEEIVVLGNYINDGNEEEEVDESQEELQEIFLRKHKISITFKGRYHDVAQYLKALEHLKWNLYMQDITYRVDEYPSALVELVVYALTIEKEALDV